MAACGDIAARTELQWTTIDPTTIARISKLRGKPFFWNVELKDSFTAPKLAGEVYELQVELTQQTKTAASLAPRHDSLMMAIFLLFLMGLPAMDAKRSIQLSELRQIQLFMDTSSMEVFINNGEYTFTSRLYPQKSKTKSSSQGLAVWLFNCGHSQISK